jgi:nucleotide-binding universal stress UspA family protein
MFDRILVALDDLDDRRVVSPYLRTFARAVSPRILVMKTVPFLETIMEMPHELSPDQEGDDEAMDLYVTAFVDLLRSEGMVAEGFTNVGRSGLSIAAAAERVGASLIVVTGRLVPQVERLLHATSIPVWVAPTRTPMAVGRILLPVDGGPAEKEALAAAAFLATSLRSGIVLLQAGAETSLAAARTFLRDQGLTPEIVVPPKESATELLGRIDELRAGLIVLGAGDLVHGLLRRMRLPMLVVRPQEAPPPPESAPLPERLQIPTGLWTRRTPANPLRGIGDQ